MLDDDLEKALKAGSASIAEAAMPKSAESVRARGNQRRRRKAAGSAVLAVAILAGGGSAFAAVKSAQAPPPVTRHVTPSPQVTTSPPAPRPSTSASHSPRMLPAGQTGSRADVPWTLVGPGWNLAESSTGQPNVSGQYAGGGQMTLYLVDPPGGRYVLFRQPAGESPWRLLAWSGDGARALFEVDAQPLTASGYEVVTLATGAVSSLTLPAGVTPAGFTRPDGTNIIAVARIPRTSGLPSTGGTLKLQRYSLTGQLQATLTSHVIGSGQPADANCLQYCGAVSSPDGTSVVWTDGGSLQLIANAGGLVRDLPVPGAGQNPACAPIRWRDPQTVLADCTGPSGRRLWLVPAGGATPTALTPGLTASAPAFSVAADAWTASGAVYVDQTVNSSCVQASSGPIGAAILAVRPGGSLVAVNVPGSHGTYDTALAAAGSRLLVLSRTSCPGTNSLLWLNPVTGASQPLLTSPAGEIGVVAAVPFGAR
jgi:TolB protein